MEGFNKILGLFAALFITLIGGFILVKRLNLQNQYPIFGGGTVVVSPTQSANDESGSIDSATALKQKFTTPTIRKASGSTKSIPDTGVPVVMIPTALAAIVFGSYLRKKN